MVVGRRARGRLAAARPRTDRERSAALYDVTAARTSRAVLRGYSSSFGLGARLLGARTRRDIEAVYALVRLADEVVDTYRGPDAAAELAELEAQTARALRTGYSTNLVVHSFARTARRVGIGPAQLDPFFASMRSDLTVRQHDRASFERYVHGSAEVVGEMCLRCFLGARRAPGRAVPEPDEATSEGARALGAAFQKVNFLRDLGADAGELGRSYFPGVTAERIDPRQRAAIAAEVRADLVAARAALPRLPLRPRCAVAATLALYERLLARLERAAAARGRVRVPGPEKALVAGGAVARQLVREVVGRAPRTTGMLSRVDGVDTVHGHDVRGGQGSAGGGDG